jgi:hypothetical protein
MLEVLVDDDMVVLMAPTARHPLDHLDVLATLVLTLEAEVYPTLVTAMRPLVIGAEVVPGVMG